MVMIDTVTLQVSDSVHGGLDVHGESDRARAAVRAIRISVAQATRLLLARGGRTRPRFHGASVARLQVHSAHVTRRCMPCKERYCSLYALHAL